MKKILFLALILLANVSFGQVKKARKKKSKPTSEIITPTKQGIDSNTGRESLGAVQVEEHADNNVIYASTGIEIQPRFNGGLEEFYKFIASNYKTPTDPDFVNGKVIVSFVVEKDGSLTDIKVLRDTGFGTGQEAIRVLKLSPKWIPGQQNGHVVRSNNQLPISVVANSGK